MDMTIREEKEFLKRIKAAQLLNIFVQDEITLNSHIRGCLLYTSDAADEL